MRHNRRKRSRGKAASGDERIDYRYVMQFCGWLVLGVAVLLALSAVRATYRWAQRDAYVRTEMEVTDPGSRMGRSLTVRIVSTGAELSVDMVPLMPRGGWPKGVSRHAVWYNPDGLVRFGIRLFDQRVISAERHPSFGEGGEAAWRWAIVAIVAGFAAFLISRPYAV